MLFYSQKTATLDTIVISIMAASGAAAFFAFFYQHNSRTATFWAIAFAGEMFGFISGVVLAKYHRDDARAIAALQRPVDTAAPETQAPSDALPPEPYLDPSHPRYSAKLAAAISTWLAMEDESLRKGKSPSAAMTAWLEKNYAELGLAHKRGSDKHRYIAGDMNKTAIAEVSKICNWEPEGGAPSTPAS